MKHVRGRDFPADQVERAMTSLTIKSFRGWRSRAAALLGLAIGAGTLIMGLAGPASAELCTPQVVGCTTYEAYQVTGTPDNSLAEWAGLPDGNVLFFRSVPNGTTLYLVCQVNDGPQIDPEFNLASDGTYVPSRTWDLVYDPGLPVPPGGSHLAWVYDWWMNTPPQQEAYNWHSWPDTAHRCTNLPNG
jgi:hypothetical protein